MCWAPLAQLKQTGAARVCRPARQPLATRLRACGNAGRPWAAHRAAGEHEVAVQAQHEEVSPVRVHAVHDRGVPAQVHAADPVHEHKALLRQHARGGRLHEKPARARLARPDPLPQPSACPCTRMHSCGPVHRSPGSARWVSRSAQCSYHWLPRRARPSSAQPGPAGRAAVLAPRDVLAQRPDGAAKVDVELALARRAGANAAAQGRHAAGVQLLQQVQPLAGRRGAARGAEGPRRAMPRGNCAERPAGRQQGDWRRLERRRGGATPALASMAAASGIVALSRACCLLLYSAAFALLKQAKRFTITCRSWTKIRKVSESPGLLKGLNRQTFPKLVSAHSGVLQEQ